MSRMRVSRPIPYIVFFVSLFFQAIIILGRLAARDKRVDQIALGIEVLPVFVAMDLRRGTPFVTPLVMVEFLWSFPRLWGAHGANGLSRCWVHTGFGVVRHCFLCAGEVSALSGGLRAPPT